MESQDSASGLSDATDRCSLGDCSDLWDIPRDCASPVLEYSRDAQNTRDVGSTVHPSLVSAPSWTVQRPYEISISCFDPCGLDILWLVLRCGVVWFGRESSVDHLYHLILHPQHPFHTIIHTYDIDLRLTTHTIYTMI
jgi:hypothetical protein